MTANFLSIRTAARRVLPRATLVFLLISAAPARAEDVGSLYFDLNAFLGYSSMSVLSGAKAPTLSQGGGGATLGYLLTDWLALGGTSDFRLVTQYLDVDPAVGNRSGTRWNLVSPTMVLMFGRFLLKADYQLLGDFKLTNPTATGQALAFTEPSGFRVGMQYIGLGFGALHFGGYYETIKFGQESFNGAKVALDPKLGFWQAGLTLTYVFAGGPRMGWDLGF